MTRDRVADRQRAIDWAVQGLRIDPWREATIRTLIELRSEAGDPAGARREYQEFAARLQREYDVAPDVEATALYARVGADGPAAPRLVSRLPQEVTRYSAENLRSHRFARYSLANVW